jgi:CHAT domain-containing protein
MQAGVPGVLGTFWQVDDLSTMLLMRRFYELHVQHNWLPAAALREAQLWLRGLTKEIAISELKRYKELVADEAEIQDGDWPPGLFPFDHPYYWAAFALHGW